MIKTRCVVCAFFAGLLMCAIFVCGARPAFSVVGSEDIDDETFYRFRQEHERMMKSEQEKKEQELTLEQLRIAEEKKEALTQESTIVKTEDEKILDEKKRKELAKEISELQVELVPKKRRWQDRIQFMPFSRTSYNSNLLHQPRHSEKADVYFENGATAKAELGTRKTQADVTYTGNYFSFCKENKYSRLEHHGIVELGYNMSSKTKATGSYRLYRGAEQTSEMRNFEKRMNQQMGLGLDYRVSKKTGVRMDASYNRTDFVRVEDKSSSSYQTRFGPELHYYLSKKTSLFVRYAAGFSGGGVNDSNKAFANDIRGGIRGKIAPKTSALIDLGASIQKNTGSLSGINTLFSGQLIILTDLTPKTHLEMYANRSMSQAVQTQGSDFYSTTNFGFRGSVKFRRKWIGQLGLGLRRNDFESGGSLDNPSQHVTVFQNFVRLQYEIRKWLLVGLQYNIDAASSNKKASEYVAHKVLIDLTGRF